ncbi:MAG: di-trans,poly-cis-decaprenylcistransferase [Thermoplasmata archaeon]|nr:di-trans,poly-cis-decaprenylcistransferase [Thermoplasmata archaeon]
MDISKELVDTAYKAYEKRLLSIVKKGEIPKHIGIIMDGNRRFAKELWMEPTKGHEKGKDKLEEVLEWCRELGVKIITVYAFSTENFKRSREEVEKLIKLFVESLREAADDERVKKNGVRIKVIGQTDILPDELKEAIRYAEEKTKHNNNFYLNVAIAYGGREEIVRAIKEIARKVKDGKLEVEDITEDVVREHLYTGNLPDPDLILRTSGEERISNFLLWQSAYSEFYFSDIYWPTFRKIDFLRAIRAYQLRQRRFGR